MHLFLIGYRGTGKSSVAPLLAEALGRSWGDLDLLIEERAGISIAEIFAQQGEETFRDWESRVLAEQVKTAHSAPMVLALGGGAVLRPENRRLLAAAGRTAWLTARPAALRARIEADPLTAARRPNLTAAGGLEEIEQILAFREPIYRACANWVVDTEEKSPAEVAREILLTSGLPPIAPPLE